jgi:hypothetical protein
MRCLVHVTKKKDVFVRFVRRFNLIKYIVMRESDNIY